MSNADTATTDYTLGFKTACADFRQGLKPSYFWTTRNVKGKPVQKLSGPHGEVKPGATCVHTARGYVDGYAAAVRRAG